MTTTSVLDDNDDHDLGRRDTSAKGSAVWEADRDYPIVLGESFDDETAGLATYRYEFLPPSVDTSVPCLASVSEDTATVERPQKSGFDGPARFVGQIADAQPTEMALIFRGDHFVLERVTAVATNLRHDQATGALPGALRAPAKRKRDMTRAAARLSSIAPPPTLDAMAVSNVSRPSTIEPPSPSTLHPTTTR